MVQSVADIMKCFSFGIDILKLYISHFLTGFVLWYGVEKLFMTSIGITAEGIGIATAVYLFFSLILDIPSGIIADRWSRKGVLAVGVAALGISSVLFGISTNVTTYAIGEIFFAIYFVAVSGTYNALIYDILHTRRQTNTYSKVAGSAYALFFFSAAISSAIGGFAASMTSYQATYLFTVIPCVLNIILLASIVEPTFHKDEQQEKMFTQLKDVVRLLSKTAVIRTLAITLSALAVVEVFKSEFGQLYLMQYLNDPAAVGILWAAYSITWSIGSLIAHRFKGKIGLLLFVAVGLYIVMALQNSFVNVALFMVQSIAMAALTNQIETEIQNATPSATRASVLSVLSSIGKIVSTPASFLIGWLIYRQGISSAVWFIAIIGLFAAGYWLYLHRPRTAQSSGA